MKTEYPFKNAKHVEKSKMVDFLIQVIDDQEHGNKKRVWSAIRDARKRTKEIEIKAKGSKEYFIIPDFLKWAAKKWPEIKKVKSLPNIKTVIDGSITFNRVSKFSAEGCLIPGDRNELKELYLKLDGEFRAYKNKTEVEIKELKEIIKDLNNELEPIRRKRIGNSTGGKNSANKAKNY